jgi:hypothetical protein
MAKRKITREELESAIVEHNGNVSAMARALNCKPQTIYNALDAYVLRADLEAQRRGVLDELRREVQKAPRHLRVAIMAAAASTGAVSLEGVISEPINITRPFSPVQIQAKDK